MWLRRSWLPLIFVALPTFLVEVFALLSLGVDEFVEHLRALWRFMRSGGQGGEPTTVLQKLTTLADSWSLPVWAAVVLAVVSVALIAGGLWVSRSWSAALYLWPALIGALAFVGWWATASHLPLWVRHPAPGVFAFFPILGAYAVWGAGQLLRRRRLRVVTAVAVSVLAVLLGWGAAAHAISSRISPAIGLEVQRNAVTPIKEWVEDNDIEWLAADPWGAAVAPVVLTGAHVGLADAPVMEGVPRLTGFECATEVLFDGDIYRICAAP